MRVYKFINQLIKLIAIEIVGSVRGCSSNIKKIDEIVKAKETEIMSI